MPNMSHNKNNKSQEVKNELNLTSFEEKVADIISIRKTEVATPVSLIKYKFDKNHIPTSLKEGLYYDSNSEEVKFANKILKDYNNLTPEEKKSADKILDQADEYVKDINQARKKAVKFGFFGVPALTIPLVALALQGDNLENNNFKTQPKEPVPITKAAKKTKKTDKNLAKLLNYQKQN